MTSTIEEVPDDCIHDICLHMMVASKDWKGISAIILVRKDWRNVVLEILKTVKWDHYMLDNGKVRMERIAVACAFPDLRERAIRYVLGKTKFLYNGIIL